MNSKYSKPTSRASLSEQELSAAGALWLLLFFFLFFSPLLQIVAIEYYFFLIKEGKTILKNLFTYTKKFKLKNWKLSKNEVFFAKCREMRPCHYLDEFS